MVQILFVSLSAAETVPRAAQPAVGTIIPGYSLRGPAGSRADVRAQGSYSSSDGTWTVLFTRALTTAYGGEDRQFDGLANGTIYTFGVAVLDNSGGGRQFMLPQDPNAYTLGNAASTAQVKARSVTTAPSANPSDPNWGEPFTTAGGAAGSAAAPVTFRAAYDADFLYLLAVWRDATATESDMKDHWAFDGSSWVPQPAAKYDEDRLAIWWDINVTNFATRGCWALCHNDNRMGSLVAGERADLWHWKATRTNPIGFADDQRLRDGAFGGIQMAGRRDDTGTGMEVRNVDSTGRLPAFMGDSGPGNGTRHLIQLAEGVKPAVPFFQPAVFTHSGGLGVLVHIADYSLVTSERPLERGEFAFVYARGLGPVANHSSAATIAEAGVTLAGLPCDVLFTGLAPGFPGVYQVNFRVPVDAPSGLHDLAVAVGGVSSVAAKAPVR